MVYVPSSLPTHSLFLVLNSNNLSLADRPALYIPGRARKGRKQGLPELFR